MTPTMKRNATAVWNGTGPAGTGHLTTQSRAFERQPYSAKARFESEDGTAGTNPEELIAAAHAGCFTMAVAFQLTGAGFEPEELETTANLTMEKGDDGWTIRTVALHLEGRVSGVSAEQFGELASKAKAGCPVSRVLNAEITLEAKLI